MEERICGASLQVKGFKFPPRESEQDDIELVTSLGDDVSKRERQRLILEVARNRLLELENCIERRYLKPPFCKQYVTVRKHLPNLT